MTGGTADDMTGGMMDEDLFSGRLEGLTVYDLLGQDAWINLSASSFNPIPAVTLITRLSDEAASAVQEELDDNQTMMGEDVETLTEGDYTFYQEGVEDADPIQVVAYALADDLLMPLDESRHPARGAAAARRLRRPPLLWTARATRARWGGSSPAPFTPTSTTRKSRTPWHPWPETWASTRS